MDSLLKLRARSGADLALMSGLLQDALICGADMTFAPSEKRFVAVFNRFCWDRDDALTDKDGGGTAPGAYHRTHTGLVIDRVASVQSKNVNLGDSSKLLNLLSVHELGGQIELMFSGGAAIRLTTPSILAHLSDLGEPWPTKWRPHHGHDEEILAEEAERTHPSREATVPA